MPLSAPRAGPLPGPPPVGVKELGSGPSFLESAPRAGPLPGPPPVGVKELGSGPSFLESEPRSPGLQAQEPTIAGAWRVVRVGRAAALHRPESA
jgi:hypothetical protein